MTDIGDERLGGGLIVDGPAASPRPPGRPRRRGPLSGLFGFLWGMFWLWFGLSFVFGWHEPRHTVLGFITGFAADAVRWVTSLFTSVGGMVQ